MGADRCGGWRRGGRAGARTLGAFQPSRSRGASGARHWKSNAHYRTAPMTKLFATTMFVLSAWGQSGITAPSLGFVRDPQGSLRAVTGLAGNFLLSDSCADGIDSVAFSGTSGFLKTGSRLDVLERQGESIFSVDVPDGPVLFAFSSRGGPALVFLASSATLLRWTGDALEPVPLDAVRIGGTVLAVADPGTMVVQRDDGIWLMQPDSEALLPDVQAPLFLAPSGDMVFSEPGGIVIRRAGSSDDNS